MSEPPENDPLGLFEDEPQGEPQGEPEDAAAAALWEDLKAYDNVEDFNNPNAPYYSFRIVSPPLSDLPDILRIELYPADLYRALREAHFGIMQNENLSERLLAAFDAKDWDEAREKITKDPEFQIHETEAYWFFVRNFPKLVVALYEITILSSALFPLKLTFDSADVGVSFDRAVRHLLAERVRQLRNTIKQMLGTRPGGRPRKPRTAEGEVPDIAKLVLDVAYRMMGDRRGKDAVPGLKAIAMELGLTEDALGKQLIRCGYSWTGIRNHLVNRT